MLCFSKKIGSKDERIVDVKGRSKELHSKFGRWMQEKNDEEEVVGGSVEGGVEGICKLCGKSVVCKEEREKADGKG